MEIVDEHGELCAKSTELEGKLRFYLVDQRIIIIFAKNLEQ